MTKKYLLALVLFVGISGLCFMGARYYRQRVDETLVRGQYVFSVARQKLPLINKIELTQNGQALTIYRQGDNWRFKQAEDYFVSQEMLAKFYNMLENAFIIATRPAKIDALEALEQSGSLVKIYDDENNLLEEIIIDSKLQKDNSRLAYRPQNSQIYRIGAMENFSADVPLWLKMPLLNLAVEDIENIVIGDINFSREDLLENKAEADFVSQLFAFLQFLNYEGIALRQELANIYPAIEPQMLSVYLESGLIYRLNFYGVGDNCWLAVDVAGAKIMRQNVPQQIEQIRPYYADWVFMLSKQQKEFLSSFLAL